MVSSFHLPRGSHLSQAQLGLDRSLSLSPGISPAGGLGLPWLSWMPWSLSGAVGPALTTKPCPDKERRGALTSTSRDCFNCLVCSQMFSVTRQKEGDGDSCDFTVRTFSSNKVMDLPWVIGQWIYSQIDCLIISTRSYQGVMENLFFKELITNTGQNLQERPEAS